VCLTTVGVLTDVCDAVGDELAPYCDEIMGMLIHNLGSNDVHRSIKPQVRVRRERGGSGGGAAVALRNARRLTPEQPARPLWPRPRLDRLNPDLPAPQTPATPPQILSTFGDLALTLGASFEKYVETVRRMLQQAMQLSAAQAAAAAVDDDVADYNNELRMGILEAYSGIFQVGVRGAGCVWGGRRGGWCGEGGLSPGAGRSRREAAGLRHGR
jgi:hypothetical protein